MQFSTIFLRKDALVSWLRVSATGGRKRDKPGKAMGAVPLCDWYQLGLRKISAQDTQCGLWRRLYIAIDVVHRTLLMFQMSYH